ncbi:MAG TPA: hypothetical protein VFQ61_23455 [Polyangiaceae bacterium]|nr:hypothetical protein [Polyangiaceae bacterium]
MATLAEIANQINTTLSQISSNTQDTATTAGLIKGDTADIKTRLDNIRATLQAGFTGLGLGLFACLEQLKKGNSLLELNAAQNETIICWLGKLADLECRQLRVAEHMLETTRAIALDARKVAQITEHVHADAALTVAHENRLEERIRQCCDAPPKDPGPCFEPCRQREVDIYEPRGDWQPPRPNGGEVG